MKSLSSFKAGLIKVLGQMVGLYLAIKVRRLTRQMENILWAIPSLRILKPLENQSLSLISYYQEERYQLLNLFHTERATCWSDIQMALKRMRRLTGILEEHMGVLRRYKKGEIFWVLLRAHSMDC